MQEAPDLSKIVSLIMQNPALIEQISALAKGEGDNKESVEAEVKDEVAAPEAETISASIQGSQRSHRHELLGALKPYLSEQRRAAIDSMMSISDILDVMKKK